MKPLEVVQGGLSSGVFLQWWKPSASQWTAPAGPLGREIGMETKFKETDSLWEHFEQRKKKGTDFRNGQVTKVTWFRCVEFLRHSQPWPWLPEGIFPWISAVGTCFCVSWWLRFSLRCLCALYSPSVCTLGAVISLCSNAPVLLLSP